MKKSDSLIIILLLSLLLIVLSLIIHYENTNELYVSEKQCCVIQVLKADNDNSFIYINDTTIDNIEGRLLSNSIIKQEVKEFMKYCEENHK